eukprot:g5285.t1
MNTSSRPGGHAAAAAADSSFLEEGVGGALAAEKTQTPAAAAPATTAASAEGDNDARTVDEATKNSEASAETSGPPQKNTVEDKRVAPSCSSEHPLRESVVPIDTDFFFRDGEVQASPANSCGGAGENRAPANPVQPLPPTNANPRADAANSCGVCEEWRGGDVANLFVQRACALCKPELPQKLSIVGQDIAVLPRCIPRARDLSLARDQFFSNLRWKMGGKWHVVVPPKEQEFGAGSGGAVAHKEEVQRVAVVSEQPPQAAQPGAANANPTAPLPSDAELAQTGNTKNRGAAGLSGGGAGEEQLVPVGDALEKWLFRLNDQVERVIDLLSYDGQPDFFQKAFSKDGIAFLQLAREEGFGFRLHQYGSFDIDRPDAACDIPHTAYHFSLRGGSTAIYRGICVCESCHTWAREEFDGGGFLCRAEKVPYLPFAQRFRPILFTDVELFPGFTVCPCGSSLYSTLDFLFGCLLFLCWGTGLGIYRFMGIYILEPGSDEALDTPLTVLKVEACENMFTYN